MWESPEKRGLCRTQLRDELHELMTEWRGVLLAHASAARQILRKLLASKVRFVPDERDGVPGWRMEAEGTVRPVLTGWAEDGSVQKEWRALQDTTMCTTFG